MEWKALKVITGLRSLARLKERREREEENKKEQESTELSRMRNANEALGYADYLRENGTEGADSAYLEAMREAEREHAEGQIGYGRKGEAIREAGLGGSGYAAYLEAENARRKNEASEAAASEKRKEQLKLEGGYADYLAAYKKQQESKMSTAVRTILSENFESPEDAYRYALSIGLADERAKTVRDMSEAYGSDGYRNASLSARITMLNYISRSRMSYEEAYRYALALGAPEETAEQIARFAETSGEGLLDFANGI